MKDLEQLLLGTNQVPTTTTFVLSTASYDTAIGIMPEDAEEFDV